MPDGKGIDITPGGRLKSQRRFFAVYAAVSFYLLFAINLYFQYKAYDNLIALKQDLPLQVQGKLKPKDIPSWYARRTQIQIGPDLIYEKLAPECLRAWIVLLVAVAGAIGMAFHFTWPFGFWLQFPAYALYFFGTVVFSKYMYHDMPYLELVAVIFCFLFVTIRGCQKLNPHWEVSREGWLQEAKFQSILRLYHQHFLTSLAAAGVVCTTFLFGLETIFPKVWQGAEPFLPAIQWPHFQSAICNCMVGIGGLVGGVSLELHAKIREVLKMSL